MKKVVQINVAQNWGSTGRIAEQIGVCAMKNGWEAYMAHGSRYVNPSKLKSYQISSNLGEYVHYGLYSLLLGRAGLGSVNATKRFVDYLRLIKPDIVHLHNLHGYYVNYEILLSYLADYNIPTVWTLHDCWPLTGHCAYFDGVDCTKWKTGCHDCKLRKDFPKSLFFDTSSSEHANKARLINSIHNLTFVPVSNWLADIVRESLIGNGRRIAVIHNGVDLEIFRPLGIKDSTIKKYKILGVADGYDERKGLDDFIKLSQILGDGFEITLVGLKKDEFKKIPPQVIGIGRTSNVEALVRLYNEADVYLNPTYSDNFPTTNIEALACGTPVITYRTGGSPEAIDSNTGVIVDQGDINGLASVITQLKEHPLSSNDCRLRAERLYDKNISFEKYVDLYKQILTKSNVHTLF